MSLIKALASTTLLMILAACSGVETHPDDTRAFEAANYHYYTWRNEPLTNQSKSADPLYRVDPLLRQAVNEELSAKGYVLDPARAEFSIDYIYATGLRMGETSREASNISHHPGVIPNRNMDQAQIDNAIALGGVKETSNIALQFHDIKQRELIWRVTVTKILERVHNTEDEALAKTLRPAIHHGLSSLPEAR